MTMLLTKFEGLWNKLEQEQKETFEALFMHLALMLATFPFAFVIGRHFFAAYFFGANLGAFSVALFKLADHYRGVRHSSEDRDRICLKAPIWLFSVALIATMAVAGLFWR